MRYAVILAGGAGTRLWPLSRLKRPKQLIPLLGHKTLLELSVERLAGLFDYKNILIITNAEYVAQVAQALPQIPVRNIVGEPEGRDTANAIALAAELLGGDGEQDTMGVFTADHVIRPIDAFSQAVGTAYRAAEEYPDALLTFGVRPTWPHTGLGYIHCDKPVGEGVHEVAAFKEKPDHQTARRYVESGKYFWNSGMFVWKLKTIRAALDQFLPESRKKLAGIGDAWRKGADVTAALTPIYPMLERISIDFAVMEKTARVLMVELACEWLDVGSWPALESVAELDESGNVVIADNSIVVDSLRNVVVCEGDHLLAVMGMDDCIIVHSPDATLVCNKNDAQRLKELVGLVARQYGRKYT